MNKKKTVIVLATLGAVIAIAGIWWKTKRTIPKGITAIKPFDLTQYLGKWYEIARFDYKYEKNLQQTAAEYSLNEDGSVKVVNSGYDTKEQKWKKAVGKAKFVGAPDEAMLKVSFFGPFYSGYNVISIDKNYQYALVAGESLDYLWILSREKVIPDPIKQELIRKAVAAGYDVSRFIWVKQA